MTNTTGSVPKSGAYRPDIDGLRALAVLAVIVFHAFPQALPGGFIGVDIFFVISGYLISRILHNDLESSEFSIAKFYSRRIRRIFPALVVVLVATIVVGWALLLPTEFRKLGKHLVACTAFASNFVLWKESGYFDVASETKPLLHLWSLAVEEQFYLAWPLLMAWIWRRRWNFLAFTTVLSVLMFVVNLVLVRFDPGAAYFVPFSRFWELLAGALIAHLHRTRIDVPSSLNRIAGYSGWILLAAGFVLIDRARSFPGWWALFPVVGTSLIIAAGRSCWFSANIMSSRPVVWVGLISYPLYLWHWPIFSFLRINQGGEPDAWVRVAAIVATFLLAFLTYQVVEKRIRHNSSRWTIPLLLVGLGGAGLWGGLSYARILMPRLSGDDIQKILDASTEWTFPGPLKPVKDAPGQYAMPTNRTRTTLYIGDSHIAQYADRIGMVASREPDRRNSVLLVSRGGCPPIPGVHQDADPGCRAAVERMYKAAEEPRVEAVVVGGCWNCYFEDALAGREPHGKFEISSGGRVLAMGSERGFQAAVANLEQRLRELSKTRKVYLVLDNPRDPELDPFMRISGNRIGSFRIAPAPDSFPVDTIELKIHRDLAAMARRIGVATLDPRPTLCSDTKCVVSFPDGAPIYKDDHHLRSGFVKSFAGFMDAPLGGE